MGYIRLVRVSIRTIRMIRLEALLLISSFPRLQPPCSSKQDLVSSSPLSGSHHLDLDRFIHQLIDLCCYLVRFLSLRCLHIIGHRHYRLLQLMFSSPYHSPSEGPRPLLFHEERYAKCRLWRVERLREFALFRQGINKQESEEGILFSISRCGC